MTQSPSYSGTSRSSAARDSDAASAACPSDYSATTGRPTPPSSSAGTDDAADSRYDTNAQTVASSVGFTLMRTGTGSSRFGGGARTPISAAPDSDCEFEAESIAVGESAHSVAGSLAESARTPASSSAGGEKGKQAITRRPAPTSTLSAPATSTATTLVGGGSGRGNGNDSLRRPPVRQGDHSWHQNGTEGQARQVNGHFLDPGQEKSRDELAYLRQGARDTATQVNGDVLSPKAIESLMKKFQQ
ncbi:hypothetical protein I316_04833 [Kwoniella heveanensis BCC8398]|uniref:Uncharacterized protein n=1 Tax=Kwoniella heveanensis BCC8398 TaxID=1296120 RepID=A0A1B9GQW0_9TREE|nr:hypothetical protein I316_04833 [Kwoniella heveanensis BCC8398]